MWSNYEIALGLIEKSAEVRKATLKVVMGQECFRVLQQLNLTDEQQNSSATIINRLNDYFVPKTNIIYERFKFNTCNQSINESLDEFVANLKHLAATCEFGNLRDELTRDRIVWGIHDNNLRARMLQKKALTLTQAVDLRRSFKQVQVQIKQMQEVQELDKHAEPLNATSTAKPFKKIACKFCGGKHAYGRNLCPAFGKRRFNCNKPNHFFECMHPAQQKY